MKLEDNSIPEVEEDKNDDLTPTDDTFSSVLSANQNSDSDPRATLRKTPEQKFFAKDMGRVRYLFTHFDIRVTDRLYE